MASALINVPKRAKPGEIIEIKTLMSHIMETGYRRTATGEVIPRDIITSFSCRYNGVEIFRADLFPAGQRNRSSNDRNRGLGARRLGWCDVDPSSSSGAQRPCFPDVY